MKELARNILPHFVIGWYHLALAFLGAFWYGFPSRGITVIGVTGTNGKSTTVDMISRIFREAGYKTASTSSIRFQVNDEEWRNTLKMTMPGRFALQKFLKKAKDAGCAYVVLEVTSEGMLQYRHRFINFHTAVFTNLTPEHIERHGGFENYKKTKGRLFRVAKKIHVLNGDDEHTSYFLQFPAQETFVYGLNRKDQASSFKQIPNPKFQTLYAENIQEQKDGSRFFLHGTEIRLQVPARFNMYNALAAIATAMTHGISLETCKKALEQMKGIPGRMELMIAEPFRVYVDYAFTPAALEQVYQKLRQDSKNLVCVFGATGGGRDRWKRPVLGQIAARHCDKIILTNEDPYEENPDQIIQDIAQGTQGKKEKILDRREAIARALLLARPGDTVVITGKGSEDSMAVAGNKKIPWDDREVVREEFAKIDRNTQV